MQVGLWQNSGRTRTLTSDHHIVCSRAGGPVAVKERLDTKRTVHHATWKWITVWNRSTAWDSCQIYANGYRINHFAAIRVKSRVQ